ncbi:OmpA family protein [Siccationidurans ginsengisoli]|nr:MULTISPECIES: OmpA family protein [unclassified Hymenobacter]MBO2033129.1 OmpA family protein [Hymenobacter sp. BT559]
MKTYYALLFALLLGATSAHAQFNLSELGNRAKNAVNNRLNQRTDQAINKALDKTEGAAKNAAGTAPSANSPASPGTDPAGGERTGTRYDFVPGTKVLFEDKLAGEPVGEFPARWQLQQGSAELVSTSGQLAIALQKDTRISPLIKQTNYLPAVFTLEMDVFLVPHQHMDVFFWDERQHHQPTNGDLAALEVTERGITMPDRQLGQELPEPTSTEGHWHHVALAFNQRSLKGYLDQNRTLNVPDVNGRPTSLTLGARPTYGETKPLLIRNVRLAEGGKDLYARLMTDGRIVSHDILFDPGQAVIKPASQPALDQLASLLQSQPTLRFSVEGHTDSDGDAAANLKLSQARAEAVRAALLKSGIAADRLTARGLGETKPLDPSNTPAAKAQNRRVEFVKL